jgi:SAM-dependent methyltransferase
MEVSWAQEVAALEPGDLEFPGGLERVNIALNRRRLAEFVEQFGGDSDVRDLLLLDLLGVAINAEISSTGAVEDLLPLSFRPFRLWEYSWLYKTLDLASGSFNVLDLGGPASHLTIAAALAGNRVKSIDINPRIVQAGQRSANRMRLSNYLAEAGDMRHLDTLPPDSFDRIACCSVLEHLQGPDQKRALSEMARVLAPGGIIGLTFDYGPAAPGANAHLPSPHEPPANPDEIRERFVHSGLHILGNNDIETPIPGSLFSTGEVSYTMGSLFLGKPPLRNLDPPAPLGSTTSFISGLCIPDLPEALYRKAIRYRSQSADLRAQTAAASERLTALELAHSELRRVYEEAQRRGAHLEEAHSELRRVYEEAQRRGDHLQEVTALAEKQERLIAELRQIADQPVQD